MTFSRMMQSLFVLFTHIFMCTLAAQPLPDKTIQYIIPFPAAGESDIVARLQSDISIKKYNQQMLVINRAGAGGALVWSQLNTWNLSGRREYPTYHLTTSARGYSI